MIREYVHESLEAMGYTPLRRLETGETAGVMDRIYTAGLFVGLSVIGWRTCFCYETRAAAEAALQSWDGHGDPPGPWIKQKPEERRGPWFATEKADG